MLMYEYMVKVILFLSDIMQRNANKFLKDSYGYSYCSFFFKSFFTIMTIVIKHDLKKIVDKIGLWIFLKEKPGFLNELRFELRN